MHAQRVTSYITQGKFTRFRRLDRPEPTRCRDADTSAPLVLVPLSTGRTATVFAQDYDYLVGTLGITPYWQDSHSGNGYYYVRCGAAGLATSRFVMVGRLILNAPARAVVHHRDGDRLNLRRSNLYTTEGWSKGREQAAIEHAKSGGEF